jgi:LmbE family N-acetylglucosaminyl deacetylase
MRSEAELIPYHSTDLTGRRVLVFAPHPDDETIGCGGSLAIHADAGDPVKVVFMTNGAAGDMSGSWDRQAYILMRQKEAATACACLGTGDIEFWDYEDRRLDAAPGAVSRMMDLLEDFRPDLVYAPSSLEIHPDHRAACALVGEAAQRIDLGLDVAFYEIGQPIRVNTLVDITGVIERKRTALSVYKTQLRERPYDDLALALSRYRSATLPRGAAYAEGFAVYSATLLKKENRKELKALIWSGFPDEAVLQSRGKWGGLDLAKCGAWLAQQWKRR